MSDTTKTGDTTTEAGSNTEAGANTDTNTAQKQEGQQQEGQQQDGKQQTAQEGTKPDAAADEKATAGDTAPAIEVKLPEGVEVNSGLLEVLKGSVKDSASGQALVDAYLADQKRVADGWEQTKAGWKKELEADKELDKAAVSRALTRFGSPDLVQFLESSGLGDHPELARLLNRIGKATQDDSIAGTSGAAAPNAGGNPMYALYTTMKKD